MSRAVPHALFGAPELPDAERQSGSRRMVNLMEFLREAGWDVSIVSHSPGRPEDRRRLQQMGVAVYPDSDLDSLLRAHEFTMALLVFWFYAERMIEPIRAALPQARIVVDSLDLHFLRHSRECFGRQAANGSALDKGIGPALARELNAYAQADAVFTVSEKEAELIADLSNGRVLTFCVPDCEDAGLFAAANGEREGVVFVGNFKHPPNRDAVEFLCEEVVPKIDPGVLAGNPISVVGNALEGDTLALCRHTPGVRAVGWVPSIVPYLQRAKASIVPLRYGAGTKRKLIQAMMVGTPTVASQIAVEGIDVEHGDGVLVADGAAEFAQALTDLLGDDSLRERVRGGARAATEVHRREFAAARFAHALKAISAGEAEPPSGVPGAPPAIDSEVMKRDWDDRAKSNAMHYIASGQEEWDEDEFFESGRTNVEQYVSSDLERVAMGRDPKTMRALEIGCGIGRMTRHFAELFGEIHGVDVSSEMIAEGKAKLADLPNAYLYETSGSDLGPFEDEFFDFAFSFIVFQHIPYREAIISYFRELHRTLKPGCLFKFQVQGGEIESPDTWRGVGFTADEMDRLAAEIGFEPIDATGAGTQYFWHWWLRG